MILNDAKNYIKNGKIDYEKLMKHILEVLIKEGLIQKRPVKKGPGSSPPGDKNDPVNPKPQSSDDDGDSSETHFIDWSNALINPGPSGNNTGGGEGIDSGGGPPSYIPRELWIIPEQSITIPTPTPPVIPQPPTTTF